MMQPVLSSTQFSQAMVVQSMIWVDPELPAYEQSLDAELALEAQSEPLGSLDDERMAKELTLSVNVAAHDVEGESERLRAQVVLKGGASSPLPDGMAVDDLDTLLSANCVSFLYATARTYLEMMSSMTSIQRFTLPAIDPFKVVRREA